MGDITINIDLDSFETDIKKFKAYLDKFEDAIEDAIQEIMGRAELKLMENIAKYGLGGSELASEVSVRRIDEYSFELVSGSDYSMFVEFGTGVVGAGNPHPDPQAGWFYDLGSHGEKGWWYVTDNPYPNQPTWTDPDGNLRAWTRGQPARPYMYDTYMYIRRIATRTVNKHIRRIAV